jgi:hypothetical protein
VVQGLVEYQEDAEEDALSGDEDPQTAEDGSELSLADADQALEASEE